MTDFISFSEFLFLRIVLLLCAQSFDGEDCAVNDSSSKRRTQVRHLRGDVIVVSVFVSHTLEFFLSERRQLAGISTKLVVRLSNDRIPNPFAFYETHLQKIKNTGLLIPLLVPYLHTERQWNLASATLSRESVRLFDSGILDFSFHFEFINEY
jgi:hypothetical protein